MTGAGASSQSGPRTLIMRLAERGIDLKSIAQIAGHTSIRTTAMYVEAVAGDVTVQCVLPALVYQQQDTPNAMRYYRRPNVRAKVTVHEAHAHPNA
jgi:hypothetical protein